MRTLVPTLWGLVLLGLVLKFMHLPFASIILILSCSALAVLYYLPKGGAIRTPDVIATRMEIFGINMARYGVATTVLGVLFMYQHWPNGRVFLLVGGTTSLVAYVVLRRATQQHPELHGVYSSTMTLMVTMVLGAAINFMVFNKWPDPVEMLWPRQEQVEEQLSNIHPNTDRR